MGVIEVDDVSKRFKLYKDRPGSVKEIFTKFASKRYEDFWSLRDVSLEVEEGTVYGLIGHNGCGKSTLLRLMAGIYKPTKGTVRTEGRISALLELGAGFHPELTGRENVYLNASILGLKRKETDRLFDDIVAFSGLEAFIDSPVKHYSSGMFVRLGFSVAVHVDPQILLIDEVIAVGDEEFQRRCFEHLASLRNRGVTIVLVTHSLPLVQTMCDHATWMDHGQVKATGAALDVVGEYLELVNRNEEEAHPAEAPKQRTEERTTPLTVEGVEFLTGSGEATKFGLTGEPLTVRIHWRARETVEWPIFSFAVDSEGGQHLSTAGMQGRVEGVGPFRGEGIVDYRIDRLPLAPGSFVLNVAAHDPRGVEVVDRIDNAATLWVRPGKRLVPGLLDLGGTWDTPRGAAGS
ncbi:ABC transporter ATP-binding protein [Rhabdothermincola salaria]|uniref:ABC transporter ATP-binding protein n=1 Tax=Rhabdothermincola salaria TaxID=2903142 RepID=UPI001E4BF7A5|nr:ABC transporter ATP-binding protein [Rhabdothermincola salaria]